MAIDVKGAMAVHLVRVLVFVRHGSEAKQEICWKNLAPLFSHEGGRLLPSKGNCTHTLNENSQTQHVMV